ncbi:MAG: tetratricopeptide repeat-containing sensor histidine kinase [Bacteroidales bacterium]|nr:tetratricopeptide repeat-containing sensor histidine kinase [Bacteroidales bacterium]
MLVLLDKAIKRAEATNDTVVYYESNLEKVYVLKNIGNKSEAVDLTRTLLERARKEGDKYYEAKCLKTLGEISRAKASLEAALSYLFGALEIYKDIQNKQGMSETFNRLSATYYELSEYENAQQYADSSLRISKAIKDSALVGSNYEILGSIYSYKGSRKGLDYFHKARRIYQKYAPNEVPNVLSNIMLHYERKDDYKKAIEVGKKAFKLARQQGTKDHIEYTAKRLSDAYRDNNDYKKALKYLQKHVDTKVNQYQQTQEDLASFYRHRFEARKKQHQIELQKKRIQQEETKQKYYLVGIGALSLFLIGGVFAYMKIVRKNKTLNLQKEKIEEQQNKIIKQNEELQSTNQKLIKVDQLKQDMTNMLVHDLKNPLNVVMNLAENRQVQSAGNTMYNLISNMLDVNKYEEVTLTPRWAECNLKRLISNAVEQVQLLLERKQLSIQNDIPDEVYVNADEELITRVFVNFLNNAIEYSKENMPVILSIGEQIHKQGNHFIEIYVTNYGTGISEENKNKIFNRYFGENQNSHQIKPTGLGLTFCKMVVEAHNGTVGVESEKGKYARFYFTLPMA